MLKTLKPDTFAGLPNAKCGEVYFQSLNSYRIDCTFCEMKSFVFADFLLHIQNEHFDNGLLNAEVLVPKQEKIETNSPQLVNNHQSQLNPFTWHEVANDDDDADADADNNSEHAFIEDPKELHHNDGDDDDDDDYDNTAVEDPVGLTNSIMKWDRSSLAADQVRQTRALKIDYNEESDIENTDGQQQEQHKQQHVTSLKAKKEQLACAQCSKVYQSKKTLERHMERQHKLSISIVMANTDVHDDDGDVDDDDDDDNDDDDVDVDVDYAPPKKHAAKPQIEYKCEHCDKIYRGKYTLRQHVKRDHDINRSEAFVCLECNAQLPRLRQLDEHVVSVHGGAPCLYCGRRYKTRHELKRHQLKHTNERNVACNHPGCDKRFFTVRHMRNHSKVHSEQKNFVCESCGYSCRNKETLRVHLRSHTGERPFGCKVCEKRFPSHSGLREHMAMHSTERPHVCTVCDATFSRQKGLYHHKFLHAETKQFVCKLCGNAYAQAAGLAGHMRKHRNDELNR
ncbi:zinc finger and BTB domain-containing protein 49 [Drosophila grimshawi]|uniref:GH24097 n=1 Tax=Drosophila grimshawi TaxID=7222 RepID=B4JNQ3_DROGR|nr:zinc finger and BTB domain-containing protein 49 [Drosophila grimshawi]EDV92346.1 GH24097 [Drosophila grimshawi]